MGGDTEVGRLTAVLDINDSKFDAGLKGAESKFRAADSTFNRLGGGAGSQFGSGLTGSLSKGSFTNVGRELGATLTQGLGNSFGAFGGLASTAATALGPVGIAGLAVGAVLVGVGAASLNVATQWEAGMSRISKTTGIEKGSAAFNQLNGDLKDLYSTMPTTMSEIQNVAATAGSLGVASGDIAGFTQVALKMGSAFEMPAEDAATAVGKIKSQLKSLPEGASGAADFAQKFGSAVDVMGNNYNATEKDILDFSTRVSGSMSALGANAYDVAGWGGMLTSVFPSAERAAGSFDALLTQLTTNTQSQSQAADLLGVSTEDFMKAMTTDPSGTLLNIGRALDGLPTDKLMEVTKTLGGAYGQDALVKMVGHTEDYAKAIKEAQAAGKAGTSIDKSYNAGIQNFTAQAQILKNSITAGLIDIGTPIAQALTPVLSGLSSKLNEIRTAGEGTWTALSSGVSKVQGAFASAKSLVTAFGSDLKSIVTNSSQFESLVSALQPVIDILGKGKDAASQFFSALSEKATSAASSLGEVASKGFSWLKDSAATGLDKSGFEKVADWIRGPTEKGVEDGTKEGMEKGADKAKPAIAAAVSQAIKDSESYLAGFNALVKAGISPAVALGMNAGMSNDAAMANAVLQARNTTNEPVNSYTYDSWRQLGNQYKIIAHEATGATSASLDLVDATGKIIRTVKPAGGTDGISSAMVRQLMAGLEDLPPQIPAMFLDTRQALTDQMKGLGDLLNSSSVSIDPGAIFGQLQNLKNIQLIDPAEFKRQGGEAAQQYLEGLLDNLDKLDQAEAKLILHPNDPATLAEVQALIGNIQSLVANANIVLPIKAEVSGENWNQKAIGALLKGDDAALNRLGIWDPGKFAATHRANIGSQMVELLKQGITPDSPGAGALKEQVWEVYDQIIQNWDTAGAIDKAWATQANQALMSGGREWIDILPALGFSTKDFSQVTEKAMGASASAIDKTAESMGTWCEAASDFAQWQETVGVQMGMFNTSFIGSTKDYDAFMASGEAAKRAGAGSGTESKLILDDSEANSKLSALQAKAKEPQTAPLKIDDTQAMSQIQAIDSAASRPVTKTVFINEVGGGSYMDGNDAYNNQFLGNGILETEFDIGSFADEGYVGRPTVAKIGDAPGGEYVLHGDTVTALLNAAQGGKGEDKGNPPVIINVNVSGDVYGESIPEYIIKEAEKRVGYMMNCGGS